MLYSFRFDSIRFDSIRFDSIRVHVIFSSRPISFIKTNRDGVVVPVVVVVHDTRFEHYRSDDGATVCDKTTCAAVAVVGGSNRTLHHHTRRRYRFAAFPPRPSSHDGVIPRIVWRVPTAPTRDYCPSCLGSELSWSSSCPGESWWLLQWRRRRPRHGPVGFYAICVPTRTPGSWWSLNSTSWN